MITTGDKSGFSVRGTSYQSYSEFELTSQVSIRRPSGEAFSQFFSFRLTPANIVDEHDVHQTEGGGGRPLVTSCWLESETGAVSCFHPTR